MKKPLNVGNVTLVLDRPVGERGAKLLLGLKRPTRKSEAKRKRKKVGGGLLVPPGGGKEKWDKSQKHAARKELRQETGLRIPLTQFKLVGVLDGYFEAESRPVWRVYLYLVVDDSEQLLRPNEELTELKWFPISHLPFNRMLPGDKLWIPRLIRGEKLRIKLLYDKIARNLLKHEIRTMGT